MTTKQYRAAAEYFVFLSCLAGTSAAIAATNEVKLTLDLIQTNTYFGTAVSIDADTLIVGARNETINGWPRGSVYVYSHDSSNWTLEEKLTPIDLDIRDNFGWDVSISGNTVLVSMNNVNTPGLTPGSVYVFQKTGGEWIQIDKWTDNDLPAGYLIGRSVSISGDLAVVGGGHATNNTGAAFIFKRINESWTLEDIIEASDGVEFNQFSRSVAISDDTAVIGAPRQYATLPDSTSWGAAYVFRRIGTSWNEEAILTPTPSQGYHNNNNEFGDLKSVAISGNTIVAGAYNTGTNTSGVPFQSGSAYVFNRIGANWTQQAELTAAVTQLGDTFGKSVAIDDEVIAVAVPRDDDACPQISQCLSGSVYIFSRDGSDWTRLDKIVASDAVQFTGFGESIALSANRITSGTPTFGGAAYIHKITACQTDFNCDGVTDSSDLAILISEFGSLSLTADINIDGFVNSSDLGLLIAAFGTACP